MLSVVHAVITSIYLFFCFLQNTVLKRTVIKNHVTAVKQQESRSCFIAKTSARFSVYNEIEYSRHDLITEAFLRFLFSDVVARNSFCKWHLHEKMMYTAL